MIESGGGREFDGPNCTASVAVAAPAVASGAAEKHAKGTQEAAPPPPASGCAFRLLEGVVRIAHAYDPRCRDGSLSEGGGLFV